jgi:hypothetical protein
MATLDTSQLFQGTVQFFLEDGTTPAVVQSGSIVWKSSDETVIRVIASADGLMFTAPAVAAGKARLSVSADADVGNGVTTITGVSEEITVTEAPAPKATVVKIDLGEPQDKPAPRP